MTALRLALACGRYDRTSRLFDGTIRPDGIELTCVARRPAQLFEQVARFREYDVAEMSFATYVNLRARGDDGLVGIPVFLSRAFRHSYVFVNSAAGIERPGDLAGRRVGTMQYQLTVNLWIRGILEDDYGVAPSSFTWCFGGQDHPGSRERSQVSIPDDVPWERVADEQTLSDLLASGDIDALFAPHIPSCFRQRAPSVRRLFPDYRDVEADYFRRTGFFPIMHLVVIRRDVYERDRWVARSLYEAFARAKHAAFERLCFTGTLATMVPWLVGDLEDAESLFAGRHYWPYGVEANRAELQTMLAWAHRHGLTVSPLTVDELFAAETLELGCSS